MGEEAGKQQLRDLLILAPVMQTCPARSVNEMDGHKCHHRTAEAEADAEADTHLGTMSTRRATLSPHPPRQPANAPAAAPRLENPTPSRCMLAGCRRCRPSPAPHKKSEGGLS